MAERQIAVIVRLPEHDEETALHRLLEQAAWVAVVKIGSADVDAFDMDEHH